jgi:FixJ family two-component response regulator
MANTRFDVFLVDDDESVRKSLERLLRSAGLQLKTFGSVADYLAADGSQVPGCLLLDVRMPGMTGLELQEQLQRAGSKIPVILMTAFEDAQVRLQALAAGAVAFLQKPFDEKMLLEAVFKALGRVRSEC